jgi:hypothetical protein
MSLSSIQPESNTNKVTRNNDAASDCLISEKKNYYYVLIMYNEDKKATFINLHAKISIHR